MPLSTSTYDASGYRTRIVGYSGAGADGLWFTVDDVVSGVTASTYDANGHQTRNTGYNGPGPDGLWFTADDATYNYNSINFDSYSTR